MQLCKIKRVVRKTKENNIFLVDELFFFKGKNK